MGDLMDKEILDYVEEHLNASYWLEYNAKRYYVTRWERSTGYTRTFGLTFREAVCNAIKGINELSEGESIYSYIDKGETK